VSAGERRPGDEAGGEGALAAVVSAADPAIAECASEPAGPDRFAGAGSPPGRAFVLEALYEAYRMHYGEPRAFPCPDPDLRLLGGDSLYALGISRLAADGDLEAIAELAELISLCARVEADGSPDLGEELWTASATALSEGGGPGARDAYRSLAREP
jgi:hypothetical protein